VYVERFTTITNQFGLFTVALGTGNVQSGTFAGINWATGNKFLKTEMDTNGGNNYTNMGTSPLLSVPYALYAASGTPGPIGPQGPQGIQGVPGPAGPQGPQGIQGNAGPAGPQGIQGIPGPTGATGDTGAVGPTGPQGIQGIQGLPGDTGATGPAGPQGIQGIQGPTGPTGFLSSGSAAGNTPYWDGSQWVVNSSNIFNNGGNVGIGTTTPFRKLQVMSSTTGSTEGVIHAEYTGVTNTGAYGIYAKSSPADGTGRGGYFVGGDVGAYGFSYAPSASSFGLIGYAPSGNSGTLKIGVSGSATGVGVYNRALEGIASGAATTNYGIYATASGATNNYAGYFSGDIYAVSASASIKAFRIDHPLDPEHKFLYHSSVESPDMKNIYDGIVETDANGEATVTLPDYFEVLNKDFRYQLTCIREQAQVWIMQETENNNFKIKSDKPNVKISWQVTGIRNDPAAVFYRIIPEVKKKVGEDGKYQVPEAYGKPAVMGIGYTIKTIPKP